ncbi:MAG: DUF362 domain-containing protein [Chloroflexi bacterium]|jgi:uncharacterized Fe-S center protein|nr:DUF362 domain-containing protein [Chloroflexota bacterium]
MNKRLSRRQALRLIASTSAAFLVSRQAVDQSTLGIVQAASDAGDKPIVYMTQDISPEALLKIYEALGRKVEGSVAVKISSGEPGGHHFLSPDLIAPLVQEVNGTIVECNTAYGGLRSNTKAHQRVIEEHGFTAIAPTDIMDADGTMSLPIVGGKHLAEDIVGAHFANYDFVVNLAHFKGHAMAGFGGVIKNMSIGIASSTGKSLIHSAGRLTTGIGLGTPQDDFLESMAEAAKGVADYLGENILYINVMNYLSVDCDCDGSPAAPTMADIGILASLDPVALDQACVDLVYAAPDGQDLIKRMESRNGIHTLEHAEEIGLGTREYELVSIDEASTTRHREVKSKA